MRTDHEQLMRGWLEAAACGPAEALARLASPEIVIRLPFAPPGVAKEVRGLDAAVAALSGAWAAKESFVWRDLVIRRTDDPELLVATGRSEAVLRTGAHYANTYVILTRIRDGRVVEHDEYFDPLRVLEAYDAPVTSPAPPRVQP